MAVGSAEEQRIMSTGTRLRLKRRRNIIKDAAQSFSFSGVSNKQHDGGVLQSCNSCPHLDLQLMLLHIRQNLYISCSSGSAPSC